MSEELPRGWVPARLVRRCRHCGLPQGGPRQGQAGPDRVSPYCLQVHSSRYFRGCTGLASPGAEAFLVCLGPFVPKHRPESSKTYSHWIQMAMNRGMRCALPTDAVGLLRGTFAIFVLFSVRPYTGSNGHASARFFLQKRSNEYPQRCRSRQKHKGTDAGSSIIGH